MKADTFLLIHKDKILCAIQSETSPLTSSFMEKIGIVFDKYIGGVYKIGNFTWPDGYSEPEEWSFPLVHNGEEQTVILRKIEVISSVF